MEEYYDYSSCFQVTLRNPTTFEDLHVLEAHKGSLSDFDVCGTKLVTCGFSYRWENLFLTWFIKFLNQPILFTLFVILE